MSSGDHADDAWRVEITVKGLTGVALTEDDGEGVPHYTVGVSFSGSSSHMQVMSSTVCGRTGQLMVESLPMTLDRTTPGRLKADWEEQSNVENPHVSVALPRTDAHGKAPLTKSNRDSIIIRELDDEEDRYMDITSTKRDGRGGTGSAIWSNSGAALPEIVELSVRIRAESGFEEEQSGTAYFVVMGHEQDKGSYIMELPVKRPFSETPHPSVLLTDEARLRIRVRVTPPPTESKKVRSISTTSTASTQSSDESSIKRAELPCTRSQLEEQVGPLLQKLQENEQAAYEMREAQRRAIDVEIHEANVYETGMFCSSLWNLRSIVKTLSSAVRRCETGSVVVMASDSSVDSSIATRESLNI